MPAPRRAGVTLLSEGRNLGIAEALNRIAEAARAAGADTLLLLDQDAEPPERPRRRGAGGRLLAALDRLRDAGIPAAVVGPVPAPPRPQGARLPAPPGAPERDDLAPVQFLATSGSLIDLDAFARVGPFRADFFIDGVELEWCFRAWASATAATSPARSRSPTGSAAG